MSVATNTALATGVAIKAAMLQVGTATGTVDGTFFALSPDPLTPPEDITGGWPCGDVASQLRIVLAESTVGRVTYLVMDPAGDPYTGNFVFRIIGQTAATYAASGDDLETVLTEWATLIEAIPGIASATPVDWRGTGSSDGLRITGDDRTYRISVDTTAPVGAAMRVIREAQSCTALARVLSASTDLFPTRTPSTDFQASAWAVPPGGAIGEIDSGNYVETLATGGCARLHVELTAPDYDGDTVAVGAGVTAVLWMPLVVVSPAAAPA